jgi:putative methionine-R-sulfoxide reductase with GAF domain
LQSSLRAVVAYDVMAVYLRHEECLIREWSDGEDLRPFALPDIPVGTGLSGWVAENGKAIVNGNPAVEPGYLQDPSRFGVLQSALSVPLISASGIAGVLSLYRMGSDVFTTGDLATLTSVSATLTSTLERTVFMPV